METFLHILNRSLLHIFSSASVLLLSQVGFTFMWRKGWLPRVFLRSWMYFVIPGIAAYAIINLREIVDVSRGGWWVKSYFDHASWIIGLVLASWGQKRTARKLNMAVYEIQSAKLEQKAEKDD